MPYVFVSTQTRLEVGPCTVGDEKSDVQLMTYLDAKLVKLLGNNFKEWRTQLSPRQVLDRLETVGYSLTSTTGVGQTCIFTCHKPLTDQSNCNQEPPAINGPSVPVITSTDNDTR